MECQKLPVLQELSLVFITQSSFLSRIIFRTSLMFELFRLCSRFSTSFLIIEKLSISADPLTLLRETIGKLLGFDYFMFLSKKKKETITNRGNK